MEQEKRLIELYIKQNDFDFEKHKSGIYFSIDNPGKGDGPKPDSKVKVKYIGFLLKGVVFDQTKGKKAVTFPLNELIDGWKVALPMLGKGGKGTFIFPSHWAYGKQAQGKIPANSPLVFKIELVDFK